jgi:hypothetical protein
MVNAAEAQNTGFQEAPIARLGLGLATPTIDDRSSKMRCEKLAGQLRLGPPRYCGLGADG